MTDTRIEKLAELLVNYCIEVKPGHNVLLHGHQAAQPLMIEMQKQTLLAGGHPMMLGILEGQDYTFLKYANEEQLAHVHEPYKWIMENFDARIRLICETNTKELEHLDPQKQVIQARAYGTLLNTMLERASKGTFRWCVTLFPTQAHAMDAGMSLEEYSDFVFRACLPDMNDPVGHWRKVSAEQQKLVEWLKGRKKVHVLGKDTDLHMNIEGRPFINCDGKENMPDGEIFTSPHEDSMEGNVFYSYPCIYNGREVSGVRLWFEKGKVIKATAEKNEEYLLKTLETDEGARYVGEWAIGTNYGIDRFSGEILFDEKIGGSFHMALGTGFPESGGLNRSDIHWDMICDMRDGGEIYVDDILFYKDGKFVVKP